MCGIAGYVGENLAFSRQLLHEQASSLAHRGPDSDGFYVDQKAGFAFRRLSIIDVQTGDQPCFSEDESVITVFNGEIYNYLEIRNYLLARGHKLYSRGDSEVIPHLFEEFGIGFLDRLEGMFAIAIWDKKSEKMFLARDRFGEKPLWFEIFGQNLLFASEVKALIKFKHERKLDYQGIFSNLMFGYSGVKESCIQGIKMVPPASYVSFQKGYLDQCRYWYPKSVEVKYKNIDQATDELEDVLIESIKGRLISERPLGVFLSGGIDSSIVAALTSKLINHPVKTFSMGFDEIDFDESGRAAKSAKLLGTQHSQTSLKLDPEWIFRDLPRILDYPFSDSSFIPTYFLSKFAAKEVTVALSGDGGDEGFGGYDRYRLNNYLQLLTRDRFSWQSLDEFMIANRRGSKLIRALAFKNANMRYVSLTQLISEKIMRNLLKPEFIREFRPLSYSQFEFDDDINKCSPLELMQRHDIRNYLPGDLMFKVDFASMAHGLEVRTPFLSHKVVEFGLNLPDSFKTGLRQNKLILRNLAGRYFDKDLLKLKKKGFAIPRAKWIREDLYLQVRDLLLTPGSFIQSFCRRDIVENLLRDHQNGSERDEILWPLIILELWHREWIRNS